MVVDKHKMDTSQMIQSFKAMLLKIEERRREEAGEAEERRRREVAEERQKALMEERLKGKRKGENETPERREKEEFSRQADDVKAVSYTHLDVYKRQQLLGVRSLCSKLNFTSVCVFNIYTSF